MATDILSIKPQILLLILLWVLPWKGVALWKAARNNQIYWFIALLLVNTLAILDITYIFYFAKEHAIKKQDKIAGS